MPASSSAPIRVAAFGAGWVTTNRHIPALRAHGGFEVVAIVDRNAERARKAAAELDIPHAIEASSAADLGIEIDAITCGTAPFAHHTVVKSALEQDLHVLTDKPFVMTVPEGEELVALAEEHKRTLAIVHNFQFARAVQQARGWIDKGKVGQLRAVWAMQMSNPVRRLPDWFDELPLGLFYDESPHLIYLARSFAGGDLEPIAATITPSTTGLVNTPAQIAAQMRGGDVPVTFQINFEAPVSEWHVVLLGDKGLVAIDVFRDIAVLTPNDGGHKTFEVLRTSLASTWHHWSGYVRSGPGHLRGSLLYGNDEVVSRFHDAIRSGRPPVGISASDALAVLKVQHWVLDAAAG